MITNDIIIYIENEVKRGVSHDAISEALIAAGWKSLEVADALRIVTERAQNGTTGMPYIPVVAESMPEKASINQDAVQQTLSAKPVNIINPESQIHIAPVVPQTAEDKLPMGGFIPGSSAAMPEVKVVETATVPAEKTEIEHKRLLPVLVVFAVLILGVGGYFFLSPILKNPAKKLASVVTLAENAKSIQYSGEYDIAAPAGMVFPDKVLVSTFGGTSARQTSTTLKGAFMGVDDWFDYKSKKNETKFTTKVQVASGNPIEFTATSRLISNALYVKLSESAAMFDDAIANQGANWVRFDEGMEIPTYAYGFFGSSPLYNQGFARSIAQYVSAATVGSTQNQANGDAVLYVRYPDSMVSYFSTLFVTSDKLGVSGSLGPKNPATSLTELPSGQITLGPDGRIKQAILTFAYKTKDYTIPVRVRFTLNYGQIDTAPAINVPSLVVGYADLNKNGAGSGLPEGLQGFFSDIRTIASVYKGINQGSYKGVCIRKGEATDASTELTIPYVSDKVFASGYELPVCTDTDTAWSYYTHDTTGYYCTDSRGFFGKAARQPLGDKCN